MFILQVLCVLANALLFVTTIFFVISSEDPESRKAGLVQAAVFLFSAIIVIVGM